MSEELSSEDILEMLFDEGEVEETKIKVRDITKNFLHKVNENPEEFPDIYDEFMKDILSLIFGIVGMDIEDIEELTDSGRLMTLNLLSGFVTWRFVFETLSGLKPKNIKEKYSHPVGELFRRASEKDKEQLNEVLNEPAIRDFKKMETSFKKGLRNLLTQSKGKGKIYDKIDGFRDVVEGLYKPSIELIVKITRIATDESPDNLSLSGIINYLNDVDSLDLSVLVDERIIHVRRAAAHIDHYDCNESSEYVEINNQEGKPIMKITEDELDELISKISEIIKNIHYTLAGTCMREL